MEYGIWNMECGIWDMEYGIWDFCCPIFHIRSSIFRKRSPILETRLEKMIGAHDIGLDEFARAVDGAVDVALGGEVHDGVGLILVKNLLQRRRVAEIDLFEMIFRMVGKISEGLGIAGVCEFIEVDNFGVLLLDE